MCQPQKLNPKFRRIRVTSIVFGHFPASHVHCVFKQRIYFVKAEGFYGQTSFCCRMDPTKSLCMVHPGSLQGTNTFRKGVVRPLDSLPHVALPFLACPGPCSATYWILELSQRLNCGEPHLLNLIYMNTVPTVP